MRKTYPIVASRAASITETPAGPVWHCITAPTAVELAALGREYDLPQAYLAAAQDPHENPRAENLAQTSTQPGLIVMRMPYQTKDGNEDRMYASLPLVMILAGGDLITVAAEKPPVMNALLAALDEAEEADALALGFIQAILAAYISDCTEMHTQTASMEKRVVDASHNKLLYEIMAIQKSLVYFEADLEHAAEAIDAMQASTRYFEDPENAWTLAQLKVAQKQALKMVAVTEAILGEYNTAISSVVANNLNLIMKVLTSVSIIMAIPPIISGIWGQNTWIPWRQPIYGFWLTLGLSVVFSGLTAWWLHRKDYF